MNLPPQFLQRLKSIIPAELYTTVVRTFAEHKPLSVRINPLKTDREEVINWLEKEKINFNECSFYKDVLCLKDVNRHDVSRWDLISEGKLYQQSLSSMLVPVVLEPKEGMDILDVCAAPGSKTSQMAAMMCNRGTITAVDNIKARYYRLKSVLKLLGVTNVQCKLLDARRYKAPEGQLFDRILIDAPCSSEGRFFAENPKTYKYWSLRKIKEMARKQKGILLNASRWLKSDGILVYSTCTFAPEENEAVIDWFLRKTENTFTVKPMKGVDIKTYPSILEWNKRVYEKTVAHCLRVLPNELFEGFFIAKLVKNK